MRSCHCGHDRDDHAKMIILKIYAISVEDNLHLSLNRVYARVADGSLNLFIGESAVCPQFIYFLVQSFRKIVSKNIVQFINRFWGLDERHHIILRTTKHNTENLYLTDRIKGSHPSTTCPRKRDDQRRASPSERPASFYDKIASRMQSTKLPMT